MKASIDVLDHTTQEVHDQGKVQWNVIIYYVFTIINQTINFLQRINGITWKDFSWTLFMGGASTIVLTWGSFTPTWTSTLTKIRLGSSNMRWRSIMIKLFHHRKIYRWFPNLNLCMYYNIWIISDFYRQFRRSYWCISTRYSISNQVHQRELLYFGGYCILKMRFILN